MDIAIIFVYVVPKYLTVVPNNAKMSNKNIEVIE